MVGGFVHRFLCYSERSERNEYQNVDHFYSAWGSCLGAITDGCHNLYQGEACGFEIAKGSLPSSDAVIGDLADNGGSTLNHALLLGSPAIDAAHHDYCPDTDQRNVPRPLDGDDDGIAICDIGSVETPMGMISRFFLPLVKKD